MATANAWVYEKATGKWFLGFREPNVYLTDKEHYGLVDLGEGPHPDPVLERFDPVTGRRPATAEEITESKGEVKELSMKAQVAENPTVLAFARVVYRYLPDATKPKTFAAFVQELTANYAADSVTAETARVRRAAVKPAKTKRVAKK